MHYPIFSIHNLHSFQERYRQGSNRCTAWQPLFCYSCGCSILQRIKRHICTGTVIPSYIHNCSLIKNVDVHMLGNSERKSLLVMLREGLYVEQFHYRSDHVTLGIPLVTKAASNTVYSQIHLPPFNRSSVPFLRPINQTTFLSTALIL
jgi:hypothetical protein